MVYHRWQRRRYTRTSVFPHLSQNLRAEPVEPVGSQLGELVDPRQPAAVAVGAVAGAQAGQVGVAAAADQDVGRPHTPDHTHRRTGTAEVTMCAKA